MNSTIIIDNITSAKAHFGSVVECAKYLANKYVRESTTACAMTAIKYTSSVIHRIEPRLLCGTGTDSVVRDVCVNSHNSNTTLIMKPWPSSLLTSIKECTTQEIFTPSNVSACSRKITDHCCVSYCKISNCTEYLTEVWENFFANTTYSKATFDDMTVSSSVNFVNVTTSPEEENFFTSATATVAGVIVPWIVPTVLAASGCIALYGIYHLRSSKNKTSSLPVNSVDVGTNANTSVKNLNAEKIPTDFLDNDEQAHLYEDPKTCKYEEAAYDDTALPISGQDAIKAEAV
ncbi:hypothetical protein [Orientia tsutsugamushi]|uniref:Uncharacterized protein n=1 Tax=Orientia tsutsugamushi TaxID=784 RepID=A0A2U3RS16_ORITS|nr:hypothetical protein [Orientia tsutsugamushi]SPR16013.1 Uncharacterised protein [Orientia tsutsugamushi]